MLIYTKRSDEELIVLLREGDKIAFSTLYSRYKGLLYVYACKIIKDFDLAEDLVQEVFISVWDKRDAINFKTSISSYLYAAVRYRFFDLIDKQKVKSDYVQSFQLFLDQGEFLTDNYIAEKELAKIIENEIARLPIKMREIFELSRKLNLKNKQIAEHLGISEKTVKNQISLAMKVLRDKLGVLGFLYFYYFFKY
ncbi:RNA polymerase sigma-70 factor [Pedobacter sp. ok626]|uniref:RNA polymerase sigma-70 factor n=1 Tax=Pedobacter sp. ok626 TaxID=1761882 RepID=UPI000B871E7E|nr:RNA polymerase sigma-70 factor [Pedobacter sp. ok626]